MLKLNISSVNEIYDEVNNTFHSFKGEILVLEHSLISISKWESKWHKPFFSKTPKTKLESKDYIKCMTINNVDEMAYEFLSASDIDIINKYIENDMTATTINNCSTKKSNSINGETITSELIYYWMIALNIPSEYQKWHINRLLTLINICIIKNQPPKKMSRNEILSRNRKLNETRKKKLGTKG